MTLSHKQMVFFCKSVSLINVTLWADGSGQSSIKQKMIQGILHTWYKQMFCSIVTSNDLLRHIIIRCQLLWLWLPSWISDGLACRRAFLSPCHLYGDRGSRSRPQLVPTFHIYSASHHTIPVGCGRARFCTWSQADLINMINSPIPLHLEL